MSPQPEVSVIIVTFNAMPIMTLVERAIKSVLSANYSDFETILVDNGSNDGTGTYLQEKYSQELSIYKSPVNLGFAEGNNVGYKLCSRKSKYILLVNSDCVIEPDAITILVQYIEKHPKVGAAQGILVDLNSRDKISSAGNMLDITGHDYIRCRYLSTSECSQESYVSQTAGAMMIIRNSALNGNLFLKGKFMYGEDLELALRLWTKGYRSVALPTVVGHHSWGEASHKLTAMQRILQICLGRNMTSVINTYWRANSVTKTYLPLMLLQRLTEICYGVTLSSVKPLYAGEAFGLLQRLKIPIERRNTYAPLLLKSSPVNTIFSPLSYYTFSKKGFSIDVTVTEDDIRASRTPFIVSKPFD